MRRSLPFFSLILLIISAVDSNRNLPAAALFGTPLIFFFLFAGIFFLLPTALISAELSAAFPEEGGVYHWVSKAFGLFWGRAAVWLQWVNTLVWYPTILAFLAGTLSYLFEPSWMNNPYYMLGATIAIFWLLTWINLFGIHVSVRYNSFLALIGTILPLWVLVVLTVLWLSQGHGSQISFTWQALVPELGKFDTWTALEAVTASFIGMELASVHIHRVKNPQSTFPKALTLASIYILGTMLLGSLGLAIVIPSQEINLAGGLMQVFATFFAAFHLDKLLFWMILLIVLGSFGGMINWLLSPIHGLLHAGKQGFLPHFLTKTDKRETPIRMLLLQAILVSLVCLLLLTLPSVNAFYWFLTALSNCLYMFMYLLVFAASWRLRASYPSHSFRIPGGKWGFLGFWSLGICGTLLTLLFGFVPPEHIDVGTPWRYTLWIGLGILALVAPLCFLARRKKPLAS